MNNKKQEARSKILPNTNSLSGLERRKILGWMGLGIVGAFTIKSIAFKFISKRVGQKRKAKSKVNVSINKLAVKRNKKVTSPKDLRENG